MPNPRAVQVPDITLGLMTKRPASQIPMGAAMEGTKNVWFHANRLASPPGATRLVKELPNEWTYKLDGVSQHWRAIVDGTGSPLGGATTNFSIQFVFRMDGLPTQFQTAVSGAEDQYKAVLVARSKGYAYGSNKAVADTAYEIYISPDDPSSTGTFAPRVCFYASDGVSVFAYVNTTNIEIGEWYAVAMTYDSTLISPNQWRTYVAPIDNANAAPFLQNPGAAVTGIADISSADFYVGGIRTSPSSTNGPLPLSKFSQYHFKGIVQEIRIWSRALSATDLDTTYPFSRQLTSSEVSSATGLTVYYPMTGALTDKYFETDDKSGASPLRLYPRDATWIETGHVLGNPLLGTYSMNLDGEFQGFTVKDAYRYRKQQPNENGRYLFEDYFSFTWRGKVRTLRDRATLFHYTHIPNSESWNSHRLEEKVGVGTFNCASSVLGNALVELIQAGTRVTGEAVTAAGFDLNDTLLNVPIVPKSVRLSLTHAGGAAVMQDNGSGTLFFVSGVTSAITAATINYATGAIFVNLADNIGVNGSVNYEHTATTSWQFRGVVFHGKRTVSESCNVSLNNIAHTLANNEVVPKSLRITIVHATGTCVAYDDGAGEILKLKGPGTITAASSDITYASGALNVDMVENITSATVTYETTKATSVMTSIVGGVLANTDYTVTFGVNSSAYASTGIETTILVNSAAAVTTTATSNDRIPGTGDVPEGSSKKYAMTLGRAINRTRRSTSVPNDPEGFEIEYQNPFSEPRFFDGEFQQVVIGKSSVAYDFAQLHQIVVNKLIQREDITTYGVPFSSVWTFKEGAGSVIEDIGPLQNAISFKEDPGHVWGKSELTTNSKAKFRGCVDHRYSTPTGEERKSIAFAGGSAYEINPTTGAATWYADGFRNDDDQRIRTLRYQDSTIITATGTNPPMQLWKDQFYRLFIKPWTGIIPWGLTGQTDPDAGPRRGVRKYCFTFRSKHTGKRSQPFGFVEIEIKAKKANIVFGEDAEINQTYPTSEASTKKGPYDVSANFTKVGVGGWVGRTTTLLSTDPGWYETQPGTSGANTNEATRKYVNLNKSPFINDKDQAEGEEILTTFENGRQGTPRVFIEVRANDKIEIKGSFPGSLGRLWLDDATSSVGTVRTGGIFDFGVESSGTVFTGTGVDGGASGHGLTLPISDDPQVTELEIWGTVGGGNAFFLLDRVTNGTRSYLMRYKDSELAGRETLDINAGMIDGATHVLDFAGRAIYIGDTLNPQRVYISKPGEPFNVPPGSFIDFNEGSSLAVTGIARTQNVLLVFKKDSVFVVRETGNPQFPFDIEPRQRRHVGCVSPDAIVDVLGTFSFPGIDNFYIHDTNQAVPISEEIQPTWLAIPPDKHDKVVGIYDVGNDAKLWLVPKTGADYNESMIVQFDHGAWTYLDGIYADYAVRMQGANEEPILWLINPIGYIDVWDSGTNYGVGTLTSRNPALASGTFSTTQVTVAQATLANLPEGYKGLPITVIKASTGERETRLCIADTLASPSVLTLDRALSFTPANTSDFSVVVGSIEADFISGEFSPAGESKTTTLTDAHLQIDPQSTSANFAFRWRASRGFDPNAIVWGSRTISNQRRDIRIGAGSLGGSNCGRRQQFGFRALGADLPFAIAKVTLDFASDIGDGEYREDD